MLSNIFHNYLVRRYIAVIAVGLLSFSIGLASALDINIFVNQDAVWAHALIVSGCFLIFLVARYGALKFRRVLYNEVWSKWKLLVLRLSSVSPLFSVWYWRLASTISMGVCGHVSWLHIIIFCGTHLITTFSNSQFKCSICNYSASSLIQTLIIRILVYPNSQSI